MDAIKNRYEFVVFFDVENGNPNGDPDAGNMPRIDPESGYGLVTDVCLKRKIRNYVETVKENEAGYKIYIREDVPLNRSDKEACESVGIKEKEDKKVTEALKALKKTDADVDIKLRDYMCENFYDIRTFGAVMTTFVKASLNCGQVRGPVQIGFARSIDPIISQEVTITRVAITTEEDAQNKQTEMGRKNIVPYALYRAEGYISANLARKVTGFSEEDLERAVLTPTMREEMEMMEKIIRSPQLMDLNKRQAQYLALQNQINPHFLYNTLESIRGEALIAGLSGVADMTESLAKFFRYTITKVENLVSVEEELDNCETYFGIQKYRFGDRLQLHIEYDPDEWEEIMNCRIPKLTLQPILENSIIHGTELKIGEGNLWIRFRRTENRLVITISDDGVGMDEETLERLNETLNRGVDAITQQQEEKKGGIALANVNNRIHLIFGDEYGMHVYSMAECGTDVEISIPVVTRLEQKEEHV